MHIALDLPNRSMSRIFFGLPALDSRLVIDEKLAM